MAEGGNPEKKKKVMVAIDVSECSHYAMQWMLENLHDIVSKSELIIFTALPANSGYVYASTFGGTRKFPSSICFVIHLTIENILTALQVLNLNRKGPSHLP